MPKPDGTDELMHSYEFNSEEQIEAGRERRQRRRSSKRQQLRRTVRNSALAVGGAAMVAAGSGEVSNVVDRVMGGRGESELTDSNYGIDGRVHQDNSRNEDRSEDVVVTDDHFEMSGDERTITTPTEGTVRFRVKHGADFDEWKTVGRTGVGTRKAGTDESGGGS